MLNRYISVPDIADGNPSAAMAWAARNDSHLSTLNVSSWLVERFHRGISDNPEEASAYTRGSEAKRVGALARVYALGAFTELATNLAIRGGSRELTVVQEHQLMMASPRILRLLGVTAINMLIPDVFPKDSAVMAANRLGAKMGSNVVAMTVWNQEAYEELIKGNNEFSVKKVDPWLLDLVDKTNEAGPKVVLKSSGSGMPEKWETSLIEAYSLGEGEIWTLRGEPKRENRIEGFYNSLGRDTLYIIGYPSELIQVVAGLNCQVDDGNSVKLVALPPRGNHELRNLEWAIDKGMVLLPPESVGIDRGLYGTDVSGLTCAQIECSA